VKLRSVTTEAHRVPLTRPYAIAGSTTAAVELFTVRLESDDGSVGVGAATPEPSVTGESADDCRAALDAARTDALLGADLTSDGALLARIEAQWHTTPAAAAALDMALHDLRARRLGVPLVELLGRVHDELPTSITIGILPIEQTVAEAEEHVGHGFRALKLKIGEALEADLERISAVRAAVGSSIALRVDANCGYPPEAIGPLLARAADFDVEIVEQPAPPRRDGAVAASLGRRAPGVALLADESMQRPADALRLAADGAPYDGFVVKLMKCGGIGPARRIAAVAETSGRRLMWGCMDESAASIAAALHAAFASPATAWLDLDGSFDLARDPARGGFELVDGCLRTTAEPGLGVEIER